MFEKCELPPKGWMCSRDVGHEGPCAAREVGKASSVMNAMGDPSTGSVVVASLEITAALARIPSSDRVTLLYAMACNLLVDEGIDTDDGIRDALEEYRKTIMKNWRIAFDAQEEFKRTQKPG